MFKSEKRRVEKILRNFLEQKEIPVPESFQWKPIPFSGEWGMSVSFFKAAAQEARSGKQVNVPERAGEIARMAADLISGEDEFSRVEAVQGYLNLYFAPDQFSRKVVDSVLAEGADFGSGEPKGERLMVEFSQPKEETFMDYDCRAVDICSCPGGLRLADPGANRGTDRRSGRRTH
ncbi:MAG: hypothetical protein KGY39_04870, partial [Anaerolineales bacterium]|nr:hypothetical protein [Anaerolineales bacterium]